MKSTPLHIVHDDGQEERTILNCHTAWNHGLVYLLWIHLEKDKRIAVEFEFEDGSVVSRTLEPNLILQMNAFNLQGIDIESCHLVRAVIQSEDRCHVGHVENETIFLRAFIKRVYSKYIYGHIEPLCFDTKFMECLFNIVTRHQSKELVRRYVQCVFEKKILSSVYLVTQTLQNYPEDERQESTEKAR